MFVLSLKKNKKYIYIKLLGRIIKTNLSWSWTRAKFLRFIGSLSVFLSLFFALKVRLKNLKFEFCQWKFGVESQINLQLTGKILLEFDFSSSLL